MRYEYVRVKTDKNNYALNRRIRNPLSNRVCKSAGQRLKVGCSFRLGGLAGTNLVRIVLDFVPGRKSGALVSGN